MASCQTGRRAWATALLLLALAGNIAGGLYYADLNAQRVSAARGGVKHGAPGTLTGAGRRGEGDLHNELARADGAVRALDVPWGSVFAAIEAAGSPDVSLLAFDPAPEKRMLKLQAEARNMEAVLVYLRALSSAPGFSSVSLQSHQVQQADPNHPVRIQVLVEWRVAP